MFANLIPVNESDFLSYGVEESSYSGEKELYKVYNDGGHFVATKAFSYSKGNQERIEKTSKEMRDYFRSIYRKGFNAGLRRNALQNYVKSELAVLAPDYTDLDGFVAEQIKGHLHNLYARKKRFRRKGSLNHWNYFLTITYDDNKHTEESFRKKLLRCFSNLHTRRDWLIMGGFERAPETGRLHFHGVAYVPENEMLGVITEVRDYSTTQKKMQITHSNDFFLERFGRNDFSVLKDGDCSRELEYILKYIAKDNERLYYSRGIKSEIYMQLDENEIVTTFQDYCEKYVLFDDSVVWNRDVVPAYVVQQHIFDYVSPARLLT